MDAKLIILGYFILVIGAQLAESGNNHKRGLGNNRNTHQQQNRNNGNNKHWVGNGNVNWFDWNDWEDFWNDFSYSSTWYDYSEDGDDYSGWDSDEDSWSSYDWNYSDWTSDESYSSWESNFDSWSSYEWSSWSSIDNSWSSNNDESWNHNDWSSYNSSPWDSNWVSDETTTSSHWDSASLGTDDWSSSWTTSDNWFSTSDTNTDYASDSISTSDWITTSKTTSSENFDTPSFSGSGEYETTTYYDYVTDENDETDNGDSCVYKVARNKEIKKLYNNLPLNENCGEKKKSARIIGGDNVSPNEWPWLVAIGTYRQNYFSHFCGATLISKDWVLTAAHCVAEYENQCISTKKFAVKVGEHHLDENSKHEEIIKVKKIIIHKDYKHDAEHPSNDIALIQLSESANIDIDEIGSVCLPDKDHSTFINKQCYTIGWGTTESESYPRIPKDAKVKIVKYKKCNNKYKGVLDDGMLCAGEIGSGKDSCQGDSGGPLVCFANKNWSLVGVVSWGYGCADQHSGVYADVYDYKEWIQNIISQEQ